MHWFKPHQPSENIPPISISSASHLFLLVLARSLRLRRTPKLLLAVLPLFAYTSPTLASSPQNTPYTSILTLLSARPLNLCRLPVSNESVSRLELLHRLRGIVDEGEAGALAAAILRPEAEAGDLVFGGLVELAEFLAEFVFAHVWAAGVEDVTTESFD